MSLKTLILEDEPELEIQHIPLTQSENVEADPELPGEFLQQDDLNLLADTATALESIGVRIACEGMDLSAARELDKIAPGFMRRNGGHASFTLTPSLEGLSDAANTVKSHLSAIFKKIREFVSSMYKKFVAWLTAKAAKPEENEIKQEVEEFLAARRNRDAIAYISSLPEELDEAAAEVARFMDGETKEFASLLQDQLQSLGRRVENVEKMMTENPTHFRLARGVVTVEELFKQDSDSAINEILRKATWVADKAMKARNSAQLMPVLEEIAQVSEALKAFEKDMVVNDEASSQFGDDKEVPFDKLYDNVRKAAKDMERIDVQKYAKDMQATLEGIIKISSDTHNDEVLEMMPEDATDEQRTAYANKIIDLYRQIAKVGADVLRLWKIRYNSIGNINELMEGMIEIVEGFEKSVVAAGVNLAPEQKTQLAKALAGKGLKIDF